MIDRERVLVLGKGFLGKEYEKHGYTVWGRDKFEFTKTYKSYSFHEKTTEVSNRLYNNINKKCSVNSSNIWNFKEVHFSSRG